MNHPDGTGDRAFLPDLGQSVGMLLLGAFAFGLPAGFLILLAQGIGLDAGFYWAQTVVLTGTIWLGIRWADRPWTEALPFHAVPLRQWPGFLLSLAGVVVLCQATAAVTASLLPPIPATVASRFGRLQMFQVVLVAPLLEEALFRGIVLSGYRRAYPRGKAVILCAAVFAAWHVLPWQIPHAFLFGVFASWLFLATGSLVLPVLGHVALNGAGWVAVERPDLLPFGPADAPTTWIFGGILVAAGAALLRGAPRPAPGRP